MRHETTQTVIERLLAQRPVLSTREVAAAARVSRQMAQKLLKALVDEGRLTVEGRARAARYKLAVEPAPVVDSSPAAWIADSLLGKPNDAHDAPSVVGPQCGTDEVEGLPRAAPEPSPVDDSHVDDSPVETPPRVVDFRCAPQVWDSGSPYTGVEFAPDVQRVTLEVASAGSLFRLSARLLLADVDADHVLLDFTGVMDVGDEFIEEVFGVWASRHPHVRLEAINVPVAIRDRIP